ncbi:MAG: DUF1028 domain-containing protein [Schumannella sp.]
MGKTAGGSRSASRPRARRRDARPSARTRRSRSGSPRRSPRSSWTSSTSCFASCCCRSTTPASSDVLDHRPRRGSSSGSRSSRTAVGRSVPGALAGSARSPRRRRSGPRTARTASGASPPGRAPPRRSRSAWPRIRRPMRQVAMIDAEGRTAAHTDPAAAASHHAAPGVCAQANTVVSEAIAESMVSAYRESAGIWPSGCWRRSTRRSPGRGLRGRASHAILVVSGEAEDAEPLVDLRGGRRPEPLVRLRAAVRLDRRSRRCGG